MNWTVHRYRGKLCDCADCRSVVASLTPRTRARIHVHPTEHRDADPEPGPFVAMADAAMAFRQRSARADHARVLTRQAARRRWLRGMP